MLKIEDFLDFNYEPIAFDISDVDKEKLRNRLGNDCVNHLWELDDAKYIAIENCDLQGFETLEDIWFDRDRDGRYTLAQLVENGDGFGYKMINAYEHLYLKGENQQ